MATIRRSRWHMALCAVAVACTVFVPWQITVIVILAILCDMLFRTEHERPEGRQAGAPQPAARPGAHRVSSHRAVRLPLRLVRLLGADCAQCRGFGCQACAHTGLG